MSNLRLQIGLGDRGLVDVATGDQIDVDLIVAVDVARHGAQPHRPLRIHRSGRVRAVPATGKEGPDCLVSRHGELVLLVRDVERFDRRLKQLVKLLVKGAVHRRYLFLALGPYHG